MAVLEVMDSSPTPVSEQGPTKGWRVHKERGGDMIGELIADRHRILRRIARGGMADVFLAKDVSHAARYRGARSLRSESRPLTPCTRCTSPASSTEI
jgi:hypothetical protein